MKRVVLGAGLALSLGCQSYESAIQLICEAPEQCTACKDLPPEQRMTALGKHIDEQLRNGDGEKAWKTVRESDPRKREEALRALAELAGVARCPMADELAVPKPAE